MHECILLTLFISPYIAFGINEAFMKLYIDIVNSFFLSLGRRKLCLKDDCRIDPRYFLNGKDCRTDTNCYRNAKHGDRRSRGNQDRYTRLQFVWIQRQHVRTPLRTTRARLQLSVLFTP